MTTKGKASSRRATGSLEPSERESEKQEEQQQPNQKYKKILKAPQQNPDLNFPFFTHIYLFLLLNLDFTSRKQGEKLLKIEAFVVFSRKNYFLSSLEAVHELLRLGSSFGNLGFDWNGEFCLCGSVFVVNSYKICVFFCYVVCDVNEDPSVKS